MSASERLRALDAAANERPWWTEQQTYGPHLLGQCGPDDYVTIAEGYPVKPPATNNLDTIAALRNALPLIADHTKAAEDVLHEYHLWAEDANDGEFAIWSREEFMAAFHRLQMAENALNAALREHLEDGPPPRHLPYGMVEGGDVT